MQKFPLNNKKVPTCAAWKLYQGVVNSPMYGVSPPEGYYVIDTDDYKTEGLKAKIESVLGCEIPWEHAHIQTTLNGGNHYAFIIPSNIKLKQGSDLLNVKGFDTRASGRGYIASGEGYTVVGGGKVEDLFDDFLPELPTSAVEKLTEKSSVESVGELVSDLEEVVNSENIVTNSDGSPINAKQVKDVMSRLPDEYGTEQDLWWRVAAGLQHQCAAIDKLDWGYTLLNAWSKKYEGYDEKENKKRWDSFSTKKEGITFASVVNWAGGLNKVDTETGDVVENNFVDDYVMSAAGKYINVYNKVEYTQSAFTALHANDTPLNSNGSQMKPANYAAGRIRVVANMIYSPAFETVFNMDGIDYLNSYQKFQHGSFEPTGAHKSILDHIAHIVECKREQEIILYYLAHNVQRPGEKIPWSIILQGVPGDGKSFFSELMMLIMGVNNVRTMNAQTLDGAFSGWASGQCMTFIEEMKIDNFKKYETANKLKPFISNPTVEQHGKGKDPIPVPNTTNYFCLTNFKDSIPMDDNDRRYCAIFSKWQTGEALRGFLKNNPDYYKDLYNNMRNNVAEIADYMLNIDIPEWFNEDRRAPITAARSEMIELSRSESELELEDAISYFSECYNKGFLNVTLLNSCVYNYNKFEDSERFSEYPNKRSMRRVLSNIGYHKVGRKVKDGRKFTIYSKDPLAVPF